MLSKHGLFLLRLLCHCLFFFTPFSNIFYLYFFILFYFELSSRHTLLGLGLVEPERIVEYAYSTHALFASPLSTLCIFTFFFLTTYPGLSSSLICSFFYHGIIKAQINVHSIHEICNFLVYMFKHTFSNVFLIIKLNLCAI